MLPEPFANLPESAQAHHRLEAGEAVFHQSDLSRGLFFVVKGEIKLQRLNEQGHSIIVNRARSGETFAEASLFSERYHCDAVATIPSEVIEFDRGTILQQLRADPDFAFGLAGQFAGQLQGSRRRLELLNIRSAKERIFAGVSEGLLKGSILNFAAEIGLSHEAVYRGLAALVAEGALKKAGRGRYLVAPR